MMHSEGGVHRPVDPTVNPQRMGNERQKRGGRLARVVATLVFALSPALPTVNASAEETSSKTKIEMGTLDRGQVNGWVTHGSGIVFNDPKGRFNLEFFDYDAEDSIDPDEMDPRISQLPKTAVLDYETKLEENIDLYAIPKLEYSPELQKMVDQIKEKSGGMITIISPKDYRDVPGLGGENYPERENFLPTEGYLRGILKSLERIPESLKSKQPTGVNSISEVVFLLNNPANSIGGGNGMWHFEGGRFGTFSYIYMNSLDDPNRSYNELLPFVKDRFLKTFWHEIAGHGHDRAERYASATGDEDHDFPLSQRVRYTFDVYDRQPDGTWLLDPTEKMAWCANPQIPSEGIADVYGGLLARSQLFLYMGQRHQQHVAKEVRDGNFRDWEFLFEDSEVASRLAYLISLLPDTTPSPSSTRTPSPSNTPIPTATVKPGPSLTPYPTVELPPWAREDPVIYLPILLRRDRLGQIPVSTPEPEVRRKEPRPTNLSDARRFNPNYENRRSGK